MGTGWVKTVVGLDPYTPPARPGYESIPATYQGVGSGFFTATTTSGTITASAFDLKWLGSYNWGYDNAVGGTWSSTSTMQTGNLQGRLEAVPEPGTILAALSILGPAAMIFRRRK